MKIGPVGAELFHADGRTDKHDAANSRLSQQASSARCFYRLLSCFHTLEALLSTSPVHRQQGTCELSACHRSADCEAYQRIYWVSASGPPPKEWSSSSGVGRGANNPWPSKHNTSCHTVQSRGLGTVLGNDRSNENRARITLRTGKTVGLLWAWWWTARFHCMWGFLDYIRKY